MRYDRPMICIGGPCHGFLADHDGQIVQVPNVQWKADHPRMPAPPSSIQGERYEIQPIAISQPNLQLEGYCYVWWRLEPSLVAALALGTLIALAMGASAGQDQGAKRGAKSLKAKRGAK